MYECHIIFLYRTLVFFLWDKKSLKWINKGGKICFRQLLFWEKIRDMISCEKSFFTEEIYVEKLFISFLLNSYRGTRFKSSSSDKNKFFGTWKIRSNFFYWCWTFEYDFFKLCGEKFKMKIERSFLKNYK